MSEPMPSDLRRSRLMLLLVVFLFVAPIGVAWWMAMVHPPRGDGDLLNHGRLVRPPIDVAASDDTRPLRRIALQPGEWAVVYLASGECDASCRRVLERLTTIRSLLGNDGTRVHVAALLDSGTVDVPQVQALTESTARAAVSRALAERLPDVPARGVAFLDWRAQLMMVFPEDAPPADVKADLQRLLRASEIH